MATQGIDDLRLLPHQQIAYPEDSGGRLPGFAFNRHKAHGRAHCSFANRLRIRSIVLLPLDEGLYIYRRDQPNRVSEFRNLPSSVMAAGTGLHGHRASIDRSIGIAAACHAISFGEGPLSRPRKLHAAGWYSWPGPGRLC